MQRRMAMVGPARGAIAIRTLSDKGICARACSGLLLTPNTGPAIPTLSNIDDRHIFALHAIRSALHVERFMRSRGPGDTILTNNNFVNLRVTRGLARVNISIAVIRQPGRLLTPLSTSVTDFIRTRVHERNIALQLNRAIAKFQRSKSSILALLRRDRPLHSSVILLTVNIAPSARLTGRTKLRLNVQNDVTIGRQVRASIPSVCTINSTMRIARFMAKRGTLVSLTKPTGGRKHVTTSGVYNNGDCFANSRNSSILGLFNLATTSANVGRGTTRTTKVTCSGIILFPTSRTTCCPNTRSVTVGMLCRGRDLQLLNTRVINNRNISGHVSMLTATVHSGVGTLRLARLSLSCTPPCSSTGSPIGVTNFVVRSLRDKGIRRFR